MRKLLYTIFFSFSFFWVHAQTCDTAAFQNEYWFDATTQTYADKIVCDAGGNNFILSNTVFEGEPFPSTLDVLITKTNKRGSVLWAKRYGFSKMDVIRDIIATQDGGLIAVGRSSSYSGSNDSEGWLFKINTDGNIVWSKAIGKEYSELGKIVALKDGGYALEGVIFYDYKLGDYGNLQDANISHGLVMTINADGSTRWIKEFYTISEYEQPQNLLCLNDGNLFYMGNSFINGPHGDWLGSMLKFNAADGSLIWQKSSSEAGYRAKELSNGDVRLYYPLFDYGLGLFQIKGNGDLEWSKKIRFSANFQYLEFVANTSVNRDEDIFMAQRVLGGSLEPVLLKLKDTASVEWAHEFSTTNTKGFFIVNPYAFYYNNQFSICASLRYTVTPPFLTHLYTIQTDANGKTPCSADYPLAVTKKEDGGLSFTNLGFTFVLFGGRPTSVGVYARPLVSHQNVECFIATCCRDTTLNKDVQICYGQTYTLPDGKKADSASLYSSVIKKSSGCDSIIFTNLYVKPPLKLSLGNDTCFTNDLPVKYSLSYTPNHVQYLWQDGAADSVYNVTVAGNYSVKVSNGCSTASDSVIVFKDCDLPLYIPTAFTPNGDGLNDIFRIPDMKNQKLLGFSIFNRFGKKIFFTNDAHKGWDGNVNSTPQQTGTFVYYIVYADIKKKIHYLKGSFVLIR